jgi:hypothetical protein
VLQPSVPPSGVKGLHRGMLAWVTAADAERKAGDGIWGQLPQAMASGWVRLGGHSMVDLTLQGVRWDCFGRCLLPFAWAPQPPN